MIVSCENCKSRFKVPDDRLTDRGVKVKCSQCAHIFRVTKSGEILPVGSPATVAPKASVPAPAPSIAIPGSPAEADPFAQFAAQPVAPNESTTPGFSINNLAINAPPGMLPPEPPPPTGEFHSVFSADTRIAKMPDPDMELTHVPQDPFPVGSLSDPGWNDETPRAPFSALQALAMAEEKGRKVDLTGVAHPSDPHSSDGWHSQADEQAPGEWGLADAPAVPPVSEPSAPQFSEQTVNFSPSNAENPGGWLDDVPAFSDGSDGTGHSFEREDPQSFFDMPAVASSTTDSETLLSIETPSMIAQSPLYERKVAIPDLEPRSYVPSRQQLKGLFKNVAAFGSLFALIIGMSYWWLSANEISWDELTARVTGRPLPGIRVLSAQLASYATSTHQRIWYVHGTVSNETPQAQPIRVSLKWTTENGAQQNKELGVTGLPSPEAVFQADTAEGYKQLIETLEKEAAPLAPHETRDFFWPLVADNDRSAVNHVEVAAVTATLSGKKK